MLEPQQKVGFVLLLIFAVLAIGLGFLQLRNQVYGPFVQSSVNNTGPNSGTAILDETLRLQRIDTDQDGLNDYQELNFYQTSPYIPDTDSDGVSDSVEISEGTDPLCPEGQVCGTSDSSGSRTSTIDTAPLSGSVPSPADLLGTVGAIELDPQSLMNNPAYVRALIQQTGALTPEVLATIDDASLLSIVKEFLAEQGVNMGTTTVSGIDNAEELSISPQDILDALGQ